MLLADGEADAVAAETLAGDVGAARSVLHEQQMRAAVAKAVTAAADSFKAPAALRMEIASLLAGDPTEFASRSGAKQPAIAGRIGRWAPLAAAAAVAIGSLVLLSEGTRGGATPESANVAIVATANQGVLPAERADRFARRHVRCSQKLSELFGTDRFPTDTKVLPAAVGGYLKQDIPAQLDLTGIGYRVEAAGVCTIPGQGAVHVLYRADPSTGRRDTLSLWIRKADANDEVSAKLEEGRIYVGADTTTPHPMMLWRQNGLMHYLVGDAGDRVQEAAVTIHGRG